MRVLVTGINGQLGHDVVNELIKRGHQPIGTDKEQMDLTMPEEISKFILEVNPDAIIHCAAYTAVDAAEENIDLCRQVNAYATRDIAEIAKKLDIPMIYISTDYVFDGKKGLESVSEDEMQESKINREHYLEYTEKDVTSPQNIYGITKLEGENYVKDILDKYYIVRISWVFGDNGNNFIDTMMRLSKDRDELNIIDDQIGSPTYTKDLSTLLVDMIETDKYGTYHASNDGFCSWCDFAKEIFKEAGIDIKVNPILTSQYPTKASRPLNSKMSKQKLVEHEFKMLRSWQDALKDYLN